MRSRFLGSGFAPWLLIPFLSGCAPARPQVAPGNAAEAQKTEAQKIEEVGARFRKSYSLGDVDAVAALFTEDAVWATNSGELLRGREEIRSALRRYVQIPPQVVGGEELKIELAGGIAYALNRYENRVMRPGAEPVRVSGYGMAVFRRQADGEWKMAALVVNRDPTTISAADAVPAGGAKRGKPYRTV